MNKAELIQALADRLDGDRKVAAAAVDGLLDVIVRAVQSGDSVSVLGFGVFERRERAARSARNPRTGQLIQIAPTAVPAFRPGTKFRDVVSGTRPLTGPSRSRASRTAPPRATRAATGSVNGAVASVPSADTDGAVTVKPTKAKTAAKAKVAKPGSAKPEAAKSEPAKTRASKADSGKAAKNAKADKGKKKSKK